MLLGRCLDCGLLPLQAAALPLSREFQGDTDLAGKADLIVRERGRGRERERVECRMVRMGGF